MRDYREEYEQNFLTNFYCYPEDIIKHIRIKPFYLKNKDYQEMFKGMLECYKKYKAIEINKVCELNEKVDKEQLVDTLVNGMEYENLHINKVNLFQTSILEYYKTDVITDLNNKLEKKEITLERFTELIKEVEKIKIDVNQENSILGINDIDLSRQDNIERVLSGTKELDGKIRGFTLGQLSVWSGGNASGKTSYLNQLTLESIKQGYKVMIYSGELESSRLLNWIVTQCAGKKNLTYHQEKDFYYVNDTTKQKILDYLKGNLYVYNNEYSQNAELIIDTIRACIVKNDTKVIVIDNLMSIDTPNDNKYDFQSYLIKKLSALAKELNVHIHFVCHPRKVINFLRKIDISGSADITNVADNVFIIHRVNTDFRNQTKETFHWKEDNPLYYFSNIIEVCKNRDYGIQDYFVGMYFELNSRRLLDYENEERKYFNENN